MQRSSALQRSLGEISWWTLSNACSGGNHSVCPGTFMNYQAPGREPEHPGDISGSYPGYTEAACRCIVCQHGKETV